MEPPQDDQINSLILMDFQQGRSTQHYGGSHHCNHRKYKFWSKISSNHVFIPIPLVFLNATFGYEIVALVSILE